MTSASFTAASEKDDAAAALPPQERYIFKPFPGSSHSWAQEKLASIGTEDSVLDIGAGSGVFGTLLKSKGVSSVDGIEIDSEALEHIKPLYRNATGSLHDIDDADPKPFFECALRKVKPGGSLLVSVPNIAHWSIRLQLLLGQFNYTQRGILDQTHLHFFTRKTFKRFLVSFQGVRIEELSGSISPAEFVLPKSIVTTELFSLFSAARIKGVQLMPGLCAYQLLAHVTKT
jgi:SAM-dependent methyltransferase